MSLSAYKVLVTGANGFVGRVLCNALSHNSKVSLIRSVRSSGAFRDEGGEVLEVGNIDGNTDWPLMGEDVRVVVHTAAKTPSNRRGVAESLNEYQRVNVDGTLNLARQAAATGVKRFIFISSIKVNGERTATGQPFSSQDTPLPEDFYGISKHEAEQGLRELGAKTGMEVVIIRPPLVFGPGVKGNFASMIKLIGKGLPLPLGAVHNKRSLVALDNLVDLLITCIEHPGAANQIFLVSDGEDLSTTQLLKEVAEAMDKPSRLIPVPISLLQFGATLLGKKAVAQRLLESLQVDISHTKKCLNWTPPLTVKQGLQRCFPNHQD